jgi:hypothetical protein
LGGVTQVKTDNYGAVHIEATCSVQPPNWQVITLVTIYSKIWRQCGQTKAPQGQWEAILDIWPTFENFFVDF